jgi:DNA replication and repair protein RecF
LVAEDLIALHSGTCDMPFEPLYLQSARSQHFRNLAARSYKFGPRFNVLFGENGQGKTNVLESLYVLCTTRSFRASRLAELVAHDAPEAGLVAGTFADGALTRDQSVAFGPGMTAAKVNAKRPATLATYATLSPAVVFHPGELLLSTGPSGLRRKLLDRIALYLDPTSLRHAERYLRAQRSGRVGSVDG